MLSFMGVLYQMLVEIGWYSNNWDLLSKSSTPVMPRKRKDYVCFAVRQYAKEKNSAARASQRKSQPLKWGENLAATNPETNKVFQFRRKVSADYFNIRLQRGLERGLISFSCLPILSYSLHICRWSFNRKGFFFRSEIGPFLNTDQH